MIEKSDFEHPGWQSVITDSGWPAQPLDVDPRRRAGDFVAARSACFGRSSSRVLSPTVATSAATLESNDVALLWLRPFPLPEDEVSLGAIANQAGAQGKSADQPVVVDPLNPILSDATLPIVDSQASNSGSQPVRERQSVTDHQPATDPLLPVLTETVPGADLTLPPGGELPTQDAIAGSNDVANRPLPIIVDLDPGLLAAGSQPHLNSNAVQLLPSDPLPPAALVQFTNLVFRGNEGTAGTVQIHLGLTQAPTTPVTITLNAGNYLVVDTDNNLQNGTQTTLTFTAANWNLPQTVWFMAEVDGVASDRLTGNDIAYTLSGGATESGAYSLGPVRNTYAPDLTRFNLDLDFRNDTTGYWTAARQAIAQRAANDWSNLIANEWTGFQLNNSLSKLGSDGNYTANTFAVKRYVDDLVVFVNTINTNGTAGGFGAVEYDIGGWLTSPQLQTRVGQIAIDPAVGDTFLYNAVLHELGHTLGLVGLNWDGFLQQNLATPQTATFNGLYATAANGGIPIPLQSQDGANPVTGAFDYWHPAGSVRSAMSYSWIYSVTGPTAIDAAILADSGYQVYGVNVPLPTPVAPPVVAIPAIA